MTRALPLTAWDLFEGMDRGDPAPGWVRQGVVAAWGLPEETEVALIVLSENVSFAVSFAGAPRMVVRLGRPGYVEADHLRSELSWVEALRRDTTVPTPGPIRGVDADTVQFVRDDAGSPWSAVAFEFVVGRVLESERDLIPHFAEIGRMTAVLHDHAQSWTPPPGFARFDWRLRDVIGPDARWGDWRHAPLTRVQVRTLERAEAMAIAELDGLDYLDSPERMGLIHGDLRPSNIMVVASTETPLTVIDFDDCGFGYYLHDFAAALTFYEHRPEATEMAARWWDGYRSVRVVSAADLRAATSLSMLRRLTMLGWSVSHGSDAIPRDLAEQNVPGTLDVASHYLADPVWLARG